ncbi:MAG: ABC transporter substrate-binding protein [Betaproteobacteria bacterium]|nr:ABC transporter substrate-binding protein [Betaproteobacteria bacterium]
MTMKRSIAAAVLAGIAAHAPAADQIKIGFMSTLSGPSAALGIDIRDAFNLALKANGGKLGGLPAEVIVADDQMNPDTGKQLATRLLKKDRVDVVTGIVFTNVMLAVNPAVMENQTFMVSANAGPGALSGEGCNPYFYAASWQNDGYHEAAGQFATSKGYKSVVLLAPNYPAGKDALTGFKRLFKGQVIDEIYTKLGQLDFAAELAQVRAAKPEAVYIFQPGGMGINFIKQWVAAGLNKQMVLVTPGFSADEDVIKAVGEPMLGMYNTAHWAHDLGNAENRKFVADFQKEYGRTPTVYAAQGYDTARMLDAAVRDAKGKIEDKAAFGKALAAANFKSVRGEFKFNVNHFPIQNYYLRQIWKDPSGRITNKLVSTVLTNHPDAYAPACKMKPW